MKRFAVVVLQGRRRFDYVVTAADRTDAASRVAAYKEGRRKTHDDKPLGVQIVAVRTLPPEYMVVEVPPHAPRRFCAHTLKDHDAMGWTCDGIALDCPREACEALRSVIKSLEGAIRHAERARYRVPSR